MAIADLDRIRVGVHHLALRDHHRNGLIMLDRSRLRVMAATTCTTRHRQEHHQDRRVAAAGTHGICHPIRLDQLVHRVLALAPPLTCIRAPKPGQQAVHQPRDLWAVCHAPDPATRPQNRAPSTITAAMDRATITIIAITLSRRAPRTMVPVPGQRMVTTALHSRRMPLRRPFKNDVARRPLVRACCLLSSVSPASSPPAVAAAAAS